MKEDSVAIGLRFFECFLELNNLNPDLNATFCERSLSFDFAFLSSEVSMTLRVNSR